MKESEKRKFIDFLVESGMYDRFCLELWRKKKLTFKDYMDDYTLGVSSPIAEAFNWSDAPNGDIPGGNIWQQLDAKWLKYLES